MTNSPAQNWQAFRRYIFKDFAIRETPEDISFVFTNTSLAVLSTFVSLGKAVAILIIAAMVLISFTFNAVTPLTFKSHIVLNYVISFLIPTAITFIVLNRLMTFPSRLSVQPGRVIWDREMPRPERGSAQPPFGPKALVIPVEEIRSIDVRTGGALSAHGIDFERHCVVIWHGPVAVYTIAAQDPDTALSLKEGVVAAIGMLNPPYGKSGHAGARPGWE